jgi:hypothetical protein
MKRPVIVHAPKPKRNAPRKPSHVVKPRGHRGSAIPAAAHPGEAVREPLGEADHGQRGVIARPAPAGLGAERQNFCMWSEGAQIPPATFDVRCARGLPVF